MKRMIASAGLLALGAASVHAAGYAPGYAAIDNSKPWSVSATLRGFYDDNIYTAPSDPAPGQLGPQSSWGVSITPSVSAAISTDQTEFGARFTFIGNWYEARPSDNWDNSYIFDLYLGHTFSPRVNMYIANQAVYSSEPDIIAPLSAGGQPFRTDNNVFRNTGSITLNTQMTELLTLVLGYSNNYYDYQQQGPGSYSALLDRIENLALVNLRYQVSPVTDVLIGANFGLINYTGDDIIGFSTTGTPLYSDSRNQNQMTLYAGVDHSFTPDFSTSLQAGAQYVNVYNANPDFTLWNPWADLSLQYQYGDGCYIRGGFRQFFDQTYVLAANSSASVVYASVNHAFTPKLTGGIMGSFQYSQYNSPANAVQQYNAIDGTSANFFEFGLNLAYQIDRHFSVNASYLLDLNDSSTPSVYSYTRNRIFFGVGATY